VSYRDHPYCLDALDAQDYLEDGGTDPADQGSSEPNPLEKRALDTDKLDQAIQAQFTVVVDNDPDEITNAALSVDQLVDNLFPNFYETVRVTPVERRDPELFLTVKEKDAAKAEMEKLVWGRTSLTSTGPVQTLFGQQTPALVLVEAVVERPVIQPDGRIAPKPTKVKARFPTRNADLVNSYVHVRGTRFMGIASATSADVAMAIKRIPEAADRFRATYGLQVDNAIEAVKPVAITRFIRQELDGSEPSPQVPNGTKGKKASV
jgi:hypothetical protein